MSDTNAVLSLGSNLGNSLGLLRKAITLLDASAGVSVSAVSSVYRSAPQGYVDQPDFFNVVVIVSTSLAPRALLRTTSSIENKLGRVRSIANGPRTIDIDIISFGLVRLSGSQLTIPHPRASQRRFVLLPWRELAPDATLGAQLVRVLCAHLVGQPCQRLDAVVW
jgi:2-amino-4-hydroxy-6-hydroxymethyldihydropteridine diphosphokinase